MSAEEPPFRPGQTVYCDWAHSGRWEAYVVDKVERSAPRHSQTGWVVYVDGGLPLSWRDSAMRVNGLDSAWFRAARPDNARRS